MAHVITLGGRKGGTGKSTLSLQLARACMTQQATAAILDLDPQGTVCTWGKARDRKGGPRVYSSEPCELAGMIRLLAEEGVQWILVDIPSGADGPALEDRVAELSDLVLVPARPATIDLNVVVPTVRRLRGVSRSYILFNQVRTGTTELAAMRALWGDPSLFCPHHIEDRAAFRRAYQLHRTVFELPGQRTAQQEITQLARWIQAHW